MLLAHASLISRHHPLPPGIPVGTGVFLHTPQSPPSPLRSIAFAASRSRRLAIAASDLLSIHADQAGDVLDDHYAASSLSACSGVTPYVAAIHSIALERKTEKSSSLMLEKLMLAGTSTV